MSEELIQGQTEQPGASEEKQNIQQEHQVQPDVQKMIDEAIGQASEQWKKEIAGLNRKNSELEKQLKNEQNKHKSEQELLEETAREKERIENEIAQLNRERLIDKALYNAGLPSDKFAKRIIGDNEEDIAEDVNTLLSLIEEQVKERSEKAINEKLGGKAPSSGATPDNDLQTQYDNAKKENNLALCLAIKRTAQQNGVELKTY